MGVAGVDELLQFLEDPDLAQAITEAFTKHLLRIEDYVRPNVLPNMLKMAREHGGLRETKGVHGLRIASVSAVLDGPPLHGDGDARVNFHAIVSFTVEGSTLPTVLSGGVIRETEGFFPFNFSTQGQASVQLRQRRVIGEPRIVAMQVGAMTW